jgi:hypothetical protein
VATITTLTPAELRVRLQELLELVDQTVALEGVIETKAIELSRCDWGEGLNSGYTPALYGLVRSIATEANADTREREWDADDLAGEIRAALDILDRATVGRRDAS